MQTGRAEYGKTEDNDENKDNETAINSDNKIEEPQPKKKINKKNKLKQDKQEH